MIIICADVVSPMLYIPEIFKVFSPYMGLVAILSHVIRNICANFRSQPKESPFEIWVELAQSFQRCLRC